MITRADFDRIRVLLGEQAEDDIAWSENVRAPESADDFASEAIYVICNSGMKHKVAVGIFRKVMAALELNETSASVFNHEGKARAIDWIHTWRVPLFEFYRLPWSDERKLEILQMLPWIGGITKYHLAKNFGLNCAKPDVHLVRLAKREGCTVDVLCARLAGETGLRVATVDVVLWRACATGALNSKTGTIREAA
jgi:hypothetical protein